MALKNRRRKKNKKSGKIIFLTIIICAAIAVFFMFKILSNQGTAQKILKKDLDTVKKQYEIETNISSIPEFKDEEVKDIFTNGNITDIGRYYFYKSIKQLDKNEVKDSLESAAASYDCLAAGRDKNLFARVCYQLSKINLIEGSYELSEDYFKRAEEIYIKNENSEGLAYLYLTRFKDLNSYNKGEEDIQLLENAVTEAVKLESEVLYDIFYQRFHYLKENNKNSEALGYEIMALNEAYKQEDSDKILDVKMEIASYYLENKNYTAALNHLESTVSQINDISLQKAQEKFSGFLKIYECCIKLKDYERAYNQIIEAENFIVKKEALKDWSKEKFLLKLLKLDYLCHKNEKEAAENLYTEIADENNISKEEFYDEISFAYMIIKLKGDVEYINEKYQEALNSHLQAAEFLNSENSAVYYLADELYEEIAQEYEYADNFEKAYEYAYKADEIKNKSASDKEIETSQFLINKFLGEKKETAVRNLEKQKIYLTIISIIALTIFIAAVIFTGILINKVLKIKKLTMKFEKLSTTDGLTRIPNRMYLNEYLTDNWDKLMKESLPLAAAMLDIDFFKKFNDNYGHQAGDEVLKTVAECIRDTFPDNDFSFIARYGGEEFCIILKKTSKDAAGEKFKNLLKNIEYKNIPHKYSEASDHVTISLGYTIVDIPTYRGYKEILDIADTALYKAKKRRNTYEFKEIPKYSYSMPKEENKEKEK